MQRVILCHCWGGHPEFIWYPFFRKNLEAAGIKVSIPILPDTDHPMAQRWLPSFSAAVGKVSKDDILVGHSLGAAAILRFLESLDGNQQVGGVVMVAGFLDDRGDAEINSFFTTDFNYESIAARSRRFVSIHSDNDPALKPDYFKHAHIFLSKLKAKVVVIPGGGHFSLVDNCLAFPEVVEEALNLANSLNLT